jgi:hypothetical protein
MGSNDDEQVTHLNRLAEGLARREFTVSFLPGRRPALKVTNPDTPTLNERVLCGPADDGSLCFWWSWGQPIGSVDDLGVAVGRIMHVLRSVQGTT